MYLLSFRRASAAAALALMVSACGVKSFSPPPPSIPAAGYGDAALIGNAGKSGPAGTPCVPPSTSDSASNGASPDSAESLPSALSKRPEAPHRWWHGKSRFSAEQVGSRADAKPATPWSHWDCASTYVDSLVFGASWGQIVKPAASAREVAVRSYVWPDGAEIESVEPKHMVVAGRWASLRAVLGSDVRCASVQKGARVRPTASISPVGAGGSVRILVRYEIVGAEVCEIGSAGRDRMKGFSFDMTMALVRLIAAGQRAFMH